MITSINEFRESNDLLKLAQQYYQENPREREFEEDECSDDCIQQTQQFINWAESKGMKGRFYKMWGAPSKPKFGDIWMHSVVADKESDLVIDLTYDQFDRKTPIKVYPRKEFVSNFPEKVDDEGNFTGVMNESKLLSEEEARNIIASFTHYKSGGNIFPRTTWAEWFLSRSRTSKNICSS
jgi:hypothetical protein